MRNILALVLTGLVGSASAQYWDPTGSHIVNTNSANVGIGTNATAPAEKLHVAGNIQIGNAGPSTPGTYYINMPGGSGTVNSGNGRDLVIIAGSSDNASAVRGGNLILRPGIPISPSTTYGNISLADNGGKVGIGTTSPLALLDIATSLDATSAPGKLGIVLGRLQEGSAVGDGTFLGVRGYGTSTTTFAGKSFALEHNFYGVTNSSINFYRGSGTNGGFLTFQTDTNIERMRITTNGNVGIGTASPNQKLTVNGTIYGKEVKVDLSVPGPDYVFETDYNLLSLDEVETYINQNKHLPEVPSAKEMEQDGIKLSEMNMLLLKKVEELTLYLLKQNRTIEEQAHQINLLNEKWSTLMENTKVCKDNYNK